MMHLSKRLRRVAANVRKTESVADIGCDHGFTSIFLVLEGRADRVVAADIGRDPVRLAKEHVKEYGLEGRIEVRQSDGLKGFAKGEVDTVIISGMGGLLMCRILSESAEKVREIKQLVLSPQSDVLAVRKQLHAMHFRIAKEEMVFDQKKYYVIICAVPGEEIYELPEEYEYGKCLLESRDAVFCDYLEDEYSKLQRVIEMMKKSDLSENGKASLRDREIEKKTLERIMRKK